MYRSLFSFLNKWISSTFQLSCTFLHVSVFLKINSQFHKKKNTNHSTSGIQISGDKQEMKISVITSVRDWRFQQRLPSQSTSVTPHFALHTSNITTQHEGPTWQLIQRTAYENFTVSTHGNLHNDSECTLKRTVLFSHTITKKNGLLTTTITDNIIHPWHIEINQYAYKLPSKRGALSFFGHNVTTTWRTQCSLGQTLHNQRSVQLPSTHCLQVLACNTTTVRLQGQRLPPPLPMNQPHTRTMWF